MFNYSASAASMVTSEQLAQTWVCRYKIIM